MTMMRKLFRPGQGQVPQKFIAAFVNGTTSFRGDLAIWDTTAPASQGASGVLEGKTLGADDFVFVTISATTIAANLGLLAGVYEGTTVGSKDTVNALANDSVAIVQTWGIHDTVQCAATTSAIGSVLSAGTTAGAAVVTIAGDVATLILGTDAVIHGATIVGVAMKAHNLYTRGTVTTANRCTAFVRCDN